MLKRRFSLVISLLVLFALFLSACTGEEVSETSGTDPSASLSVSEGTNGDVMRRHFDESEDALYNPLMGFVAEADYTEAVGKNTLVYIDILWREIEPQEGVYDFSSVDEQKQIERWKSEGKRAVLRFICDKPSDEEYMDIPDWLYEKTGDGTHYAYDESHKGYSPDYSNETLIEAHSKVIAAIGEHFSADDFVAYVELGSLGHWGEWHVNYESSIVRMPKEEIRDRYITPYLSAFPNAKLLMRRPFNAAKTYGFGLYDDSAGNPESTEDWLDWIQNGGDYSQAQEENALSAMPDQWKIAPIGGEFNSSLTFAEMLGSGLEQTLSLLRRSHTTFLGPKFPHALDEENGKGMEGSIAEVLKTMGYRYYISDAVLLERENGGSVLSLTWKNTGVAPIYWDWPVYLYYLDSQNQVLSRIPVDLQLTEILPDEDHVIDIPISSGQIPANASLLCIGIEDPASGKPAILFASDGEQIEKRLVLFRF